MYVISTQGSDEYCYLVGFPASKGLICTCNDNRLCYPLPVIISGRSWPLGPSCKCLIAEFPFLILTRVTFNWVTCLLRLTLRIILLPLLLHPSSLFYPKHNPQGICIAPCLNLPFSRLSSSPFLPKRSNSTCSKKPVASTNGCTRTTTSLASARTARILIIYQLLCQRLHALTRSTRT